jgi:hypothetical protein
MRVMNAAADLAVDPDWLVQRTKEMWEAIPAAFADTIDGAGTLIGSAVGKRFKDGIAGLIERLKPI